ncbi:ribosomal protein L11 [Mycena rebaudengoi]|nr:ribosomal protein L11 [Mycena rebaudengoi]
MQQTRYTVRTFGIWRNEKIAVHVTIRGALRPWHRHLWHGLLRHYAPAGRKDRKKAGNRRRALGRYNSDCYFFCTYPKIIGIFGMDFDIVMGRLGAKVARRRRQKAHIGFSHRIKKDDTIAWFKQRFDGIISAGKRKFY